MTTKGKGLKESIPDGCTCEYAFYWRGQQRFKRRVKWFPSCKIHPHPDNE